MYDEIIKIIGNIGFPIAITLYLLIKFNSTIEELKKSINELTREIKILYEKIENKL